MTNHQTACAVLALLTVGMLYGVNSLRNSTSAAREVAEKALADAETAESQVTIASNQLTLLDSKTAELRLVYGEWKPHFEAHRSAQEAEQRVAEVIREGNVFLISQKFETRDVDSQAIISEALVADLIVEDDYARSLNWLGKLEESIPSCRITKCSIGRGDRGNDIHLVVQLQIPILKS